MLNFFLQNIFIMKKILLTLLLPFVALSVTFAQITYEDFEGTPLEWNPFGDGVYNGVIDNPDPNFVNMSAKVGSYTKSGAHAFSLLITVLPDAMDLTTNNQFSLDVYAPVATQILFKLEGDGGEFLEKSTNIANVNVWQTYTFDMSAAASMTTITKIIIFFDFGVETSMDTYLFDNIIANPAGACAGTVADPLIIDDYECQRNASYGGGWDILTPIANPDASGINTSSMVGEYIDPIGEPFAALVVDYQNPLDLSLNNQVKAKIWAPKTGQMLFKLEGGVSPPVEKFIDITEANTWVEYTADFSDQAAANHNKIAIFFGAGVDGEMGDIYYIDDIAFAEAPPAAALEDFENGASLAWEPLNNDMPNHGTFSVVANPDATGANTSGNVGKYEKGNAAFSTVTTFLASGIDLSTTPQLNLQAWAPAGATSVTMQLVSPTQGNKDVTRDFGANETWVDLSFNFEDFNTITDFERINLLFDAGTAAAGTTYYFDNLTQGVSTVDPCENVVPIPRILDDYECQRNVTYGVGLDRLTVINNPDLNPDNPSLMVGEYKDPIDEFSALVFQSGGAWNLSVQNQFRLKVWSSKIVPILFKLEGGTSPASEIFVDVTETNKWVEYVVDFSDQANENHAALAVFFNGGQLPTEEDLYYIDDAAWSRASYQGCVNTFESEETTIDNFQYFANGSLEAAGKTFEVVDNPNPSGINTSSKVGEFVKAGDAESFAGFFAALEAPIDFGGTKIARAKVHMDHIGNFAIKLEGSTTGADPIELAVDNTLTDQWEELTFDFSAVTDDANYQTLTIFFDLLIDATGEDVTSYFDDISFGENTCLATGIFSPVQVETFKVSPNPASEFLRVENTLEVHTFEIVNLLGQKVRTLQTDGAENFEISVSDLDQGIYILTGMDKNGKLVANAKFIKE